MTACPRAIIEEAWGKEERSGHRRSIGRVKISGYSYRPACHASGSDKTREMSRKAG